MSNLEGKVIIVTGASSGIGRASAEVMARQGARVLLVARDRNALDEVRDGIAAGGGTAEVCRGDVGRKEDTLTAIDKAEQAFGPIDGFFANAGMSGAMAPIPDYSDEAFDEILNVNLKSLFWAMKRLIPSMVERRTGSIVATGSLASELGFAMTVGYVATKHALLGLVRSAAAEVTRHNVRVNLIIPGLIETRLLANVADLYGGDLEAAMAALGKIAPMGRLGSAAEVGEVVAFLMSDRASYVSGQAWAIDGGILHHFGGQ